jgi:hypothetical protein
MKNLFNDISQEEKNRILEMHSGKKNVILEQSVGDAVNWVKDKVKDITGSSFKTRAVVEGDMLIDFPIVAFYYGNRGVNMFIKDPSNGKTLRVDNFEGPIFDGSIQKYKSSIFKNINSNNWKLIAKQNNIPVSKITT